ncbi:hypothetical protein [Nocardia asteroides]|uniref:hypothetical protein n=1 Tax=Nocardia asteroides TaxID=1824 RepID=UPI0033D93B4E
MKGNVVTRNEKHPTERSPSGSTSRPKCDHDRLDAIKSGKTIDTGPTTPPEPVPAWTPSLAMAMVGLVVTALASVIALVVLGQELRFAAAVVLIVVLAIIWRLLPSTRARHRDGGFGFFLYRFLHIVYGDLR